MGSYNYYKMFGCFNRKFKMSEKEPPPDVKDAFSRYSEMGPNEPYMTSDQLLKFLIEYQKEEDSTFSDAERITEQIFQRCHHTAWRPGLTLDDFFYFLFQEDLNGPIKSQVHHDMAAPLQHYFIYTGHNSYLTGNQLSSDCSEIPIIRALENGVRGIELDLWPNSAKDNVHVLHGRTLTTPVLLTKCLKSIKEHAFVKSPYPIIITLEDHLTPELQAKVAEMVMQIFGDMLYYPESGCLEEFPSPEELKHKIILSTKPPKEYLESKNIKDRETSLSMEDFDDDLAETKADYKSDSDQDDEDNDGYQQKSGSLAAPQYKRLIAIHAGKAKRSLRHSLRTGTDKVNRLSLSEQILEKAATSYGKDVVRFTQKNILRVFPKGTRVTSTNFKPIIGWMHGAQMVAFNMQLLHIFNGGCRCLIHQLLLIDTILEQPWIEMDY